MIPKSETNGGDDMADIAKKITKLDEKIGKLKERIQTDTAECEKLSEQKALLIYQSLCKQYSCEGQALANVINLKRLLNGKQNVWKYQNGEEKSDSDGREKDV